MTSSGMPKEPYIANERALYFPAKTPTDTFAALSAYVEQQLQSAERQVSDLLDQLEARLNASLISSGELKGALEHRAADSRAEVEALMGAFDASDAALLHNISDAQGGIAALEAERGRLRAFAPDAADHSASKLWGNVSGHLTAAANDMSHLLAEHRANLTEIVERLAGAGNLSLAALQENWTDFEVWFNSTAEDEEKRDADEEQLRGELQELDSLIDRYKQQQQEAAAAAQAAAAEAAAAAAAAADQSASAANQSAAGVEAPTKTSTPVATPAPAASAGGQEGAGGGGEHEGRWYGQWEGNFWEVAAGVERVPDVATLGSPSVVMDTDEIAFDEEDFEHMGLGERGQGAGGRGQGSGGRGQGSGAGEVYLAHTLSLFHHRFRRHI